ncbi:MAG: hypothetical protein LAO24_04475 [Acidobacteriia bacterium]|nr:hypothetical protein [Terriglobia bacterium]
MELGAENKKKVMWAAGLGIVAVLVVIYQLIPSFTSTTSASAPLTTSQPTAASTPARPAPRRGSTPASPSAQKAHAPQSLDPTLHLEELAATEQLKYEGSGRNIFVSQAEPPPTPIAPGNTDNKAETIIYHTPTPPPPAPIPLKFIGFSSRPGESKKIFLLLGEDVFIAGEGEIVNRRYKVVRISNASVEIQDMVNSGPPQSIPLTQG